MNVKQELKQGRRFIAGVLAAILSLGLLAVPVQAATITDYNDVDGHWAYNALEWAVDNDVMLGTSSTEMEPNGLLTRAQLATMMDRLYGTYKNADISQYVDMVTGSWYYNYIAQAVNMGTLTGYSPFSMGPDDYVTREQAIVVVARTLCLVAAADEDLSRFPDRDEVGSWAYDDVCKMVEAQFVNGDTLGLLNPDANITRAEMAQILANIFQNIYESGTLTGNFHDTILIRGIVDIHDAVFEGDLIIANGLREEELDLNDVTIKGRLVVWGGSEIRVNGQSQVAGVTTPRNDNTVKVIFDEDATALSQENCAVNYPDSMDPDNEVIFTKKTTKPSNSTSTGSSSSAGSSPSTGGSSGGSSGGPSHTSGGVTQKKPAIDFSFPSYLYVNDSTTVTTTLTNTKSVEWTLTKDGESIPISDFTKDGGSLTFTAEGVYTLRAVAKNGSRKAECEKTVTVLPVIDIAFSLPECGHPDEPIDVDLHLENEKSGTVSWSLTKDGDPYPLPDGFTNKGGSLNLTEPGTYVLTASITDASGKEYTESRTIVILPVIDLQIAVTPGETHVDVAALVTANDAKLPVTWTLFQDGAELEWDSATDSILSDIGGELLLPYAGEYELQASVKDAAGRTFYSNKAPISIEGLVSLVLDLPDHGWTDRAVLAELLGYGDYSVSWHAEKDGEETAYSGTLHDNGGNVQFNEPGQYTLTASVTDRLGREFAVSKTVNIYPVISLAAEAAKSSLHVDENLALILSQENTTDEQEISWFITKDGLPYDGLSMGDLSSIAFTEPGDYTFVAKTIDPAGREYACEPVSVHVIENLEVVVSSDTEATHEDRTAEISLSIANGDAEAIEWTLSCDGEDIFIDGLDEDGGILSFPSKGNYVLTASVTDELGKVFEDSVTIRVYPVINMALDAPENIHIDLLASIGLTGNDLEGKSVEWTVISESGAAVENSLNNDGGDLSFTEAGQHFLTAKVVDELGREFSVSGTILVWNTVQLSFRLPEFSHTDETVIVKMTSENLRQNTVDWSLTVDGEPVHLTDGIQGDLSNDGGTVRFTQVGTNVLTATVTDELGRDFTYEQTIEVYPVITLDMTATMAVHTDEIIDISLDADTSLPVEWKINPSNDPDAMTLYDGSLGGNGGAIQIANAGTYDISASVTDATGREFSANTVSVKVYPVAGLEFTLPSAAWTDSHTPVDLLTTDLSDRAVTWTLFKDGEPVSLTGFMLGDLGDKGGSVRFPHTGTYELTASAADELGREYTYSQTINIYPVITLSVSTNEIGYTDTAEDVELTSENLDTNQVVWTVRRDGVEVAQPFALNLSGGHGFFTEPGLYTFTAAVTDELGRVTTASDSIQVYPVGQAGFYLPAAFHTDSVVQLVTDFRELDDNPLYWTLTRNGEIVQIADYVTGELSADGGQLQFKQTGDYKLKAVFVDGGGRVYSYEQEFKVYPIPDVSWTLPNYAHTDTVFNVPVVSEHVSGVDGTTIKWFIDDTYGLRQNWDTYVAGSLTAEPGDIRIKHAGVFTIGCEVTDATGRVFSFDGPDIEVLAEQELQVSITEDQVYTGEDAQVRTLGNNVELPVEWTLEKDGRPVDIDLYVTGDLNNLGGAIQFTEGGEYRLIGTLRDGLGRTFSSSDTIRVLPVGSLSFTMSEMEYVGNQVPVVMDKLFNPDGSTIEWSVQKNNVAYTIDLSSLDNSGGTVVFPEVGTYTLTATLRDSNGKTVTASQSIRIIYKAAVQVTAPASVHIGSQFDVGISGAGSLPVGWGVKFGNKPVTLDSNTGFLFDDGGSLTFYEEGIYTITATVRDDAGNPTSGFVNVTVTNTAPVIDSFTANTTRNIQDGRFYAELLASCSDPDGDDVHLEWDSEYQPDGWYEVGSHTIRVRAVDEWGAVSAWSSLTIEFENRAPVISSFVVSPSSTPTGTKFYVQVSVNASDPDGDSWSLEWGGDYQASGYYGVGEWTIKVRAVDQYGAASPWQSKTFEVAEYLSLNITAPDSVDPGQTFNVSLSGAGSYPVTWEIRDPNGNLFTNYSFSSTGGSISFPNTGSYTIKASTSGISGATASAQKTVVVLNDTIFSGKFSMNLYWDNNGNDMDSHMYFYNASGSQVGHVYFSNKEDCGCSLDRDDTRGGTGEWLTVDFDAIPSDVNKIDVSIYGYRGDATVWMILRQENTIVDGAGNQTTEVKQPVRLDTYVSEHETVSFGYFLRTEDSWDFYGYDGSIVHGSGTV